MDKESRLQIITGPNMGGKSTYIRQIATIVLLAQIGSFVPCEAAVLPLFDQLLCRVGACECQMKGVSTFFNEMVEAGSIVSTATSSSLVIVDEIGRGTSTFEGFGIGWGFARHLVTHTRCFTLFATHFHEISALQAECSGVRNVHFGALVDELTGGLTFLFQVTPGVADKSYGALVAEMAKMPAKVVARAKDKTRELEDVEKSYLTAKTSIVDGDHTHTHTHTHNK
eukprot:GHVR01092525.1.p1 GENE.GHVR01092525.1~~GHVR01092525.1.p1  ORF type:complete len:226 (+),score=63.42 GHVR01092525.1:156-833(+)